MKTIDILREMLGKRFVDIDFLSDSSIQPNVWVKEMANYLDEIIPRFEARISKLEHPKEPKQECEHRWFENYHYINPKNTGAILADRKCIKCGAYQVRKASEWEDAKEY